VIDEALPTANASPGAASTDTTGPDGTKAAAADVVVPTKKLKFRYLLKQMNVGELLPEPNQRTVANELEEYVSSLSINPNAIAVAALIDPNEFWLKNRNKYEILSQLALDIISAPASEAYAERVHYV